jgi:hypothetical protein
VVCDGRWGVNNLNSEEFKDDDLEQAEISAK